MFRIFTIVPLVFCMIANAVIAYSGGDGSELNPYEISTVSDIYTLSHSPTTWSEYFILTDDIDLTGVSYQPIGNAANKFLGSFNGDYHEITGLRITNSSSGYVGFFGAVGESGVVKNLNLVEVNISVIYTSWLNIGAVVAYNMGTVTGCDVSGVLVASAPTAYAGTVVGYNHSTGYIADCGVNGTLSTTYCGGGIAGYNAGSIHNCYLNGNVIVVKSPSSISGYAYSGGIVGWARSLSSITHCSSSGTMNVNVNESGIQSSVWTGGIVAFAESNAIIDLCSSNSEVTAFAGGKPASAYAGGIAGKNDGAVVSRCFAIGTANAEASSIDDSAGAYAGGVFGSNYGNTSNCYSMGNVGAQSSGSPNSAYAGGFSGWQSTGAVTKCYSTAAVTSTDRKGAFAGSITSGEIWASFWDYETSGFDPAIHNGIGRNAGGTFDLYSKTTAEMQNALTFSSGGWDMVSTWYMSAETGYPQIVGVMLPVTLKSDLIILSSSNDKVLVAYDEPLTIDATVKNVGFSATETYYHTTVYVSTSFDIDWNSLDNEDVLASESSLPLGVDATVQKQFAITMPDSAGIYYLRVKADRHNSIDEVSESNNWGEILSVTVIPYAGGLGTFESPYVIETPEQFNAIGTRLGDWDKNFVLIDDIDMTGLEFSRIGMSWNSGFSGTFDGGGHIISNVLIDDENITQYCGVFGSVLAGGYIFDLGVENVNIDVPQANYTGSIAGWSNGVISSCFATGSVNANSLVGGICGGISGENAVIINSYSFVEVTAYSGPGGIVAYAGASSSITNCYFAGMLNSDDFSGGILSALDGATVEGCFYDGEVSGVWWSAAGTGTSGYWLMVPDNLIWTSGWDYNDVWKQSGIGYPLLLWQADREIGDGSEDDPYQISTASQLQAVSIDFSKLNSNMILMNDIDMAGYSFYPIATDWNNPYNAHFDGNSKVVSNLTINLTDYNLVSMFGTVGADAEINDLGLENVDVVANNGSFAGGIAGWNKGIISGCFVTGSISAVSQAGGITAGLSDNGIIEDCYSNCNVSVSGQLAGGIASEVSGNAAIEYCYAAGTLNGEWVGGIAAKKADMASSTENFYNSDLVAWSELGEGKSEQELKSVTTFTDAGWDYTTQWHQVSGQLPVFQWQQLVLLADFDDNGAINEQDLVIFASEWLETGIDLQCDISPDGGDEIVNMEDFVILADTWGN